jgi:hypothetical protein
MSQCVGGCQSVAWKHGMGGKDGRRVRGRGRHQRAVCLAPMLGKIIGCWEAALADLQQSG